MQSIALVRSAAVVLCLEMAVGLPAQQSQPATPMPRLVRFNAVLHPLDGQPSASVESVTLSVYRDKEGGDPLWHEIQNVALDTEGRYSGLLGSTSADGLPSDLFTSGEARWLGIRFNRPGEEEQPRVQLVSVPYALKASDADTLGGLPASAYLRTPSGERPGMAAGESNGGTASSASNSKAPLPKAIVGTPSPNSLVKFINAAGDLSNSIVVDNGSNVGIGTVSPTSPLTVVGNGVSPLGTANFFRSDLGGRFSHVQLGSTGDWYVRSSLNSGKVILQDTGGNVGIGTGSPNSSLTVVGNGVSPFGTANFYRSDLAGSQSHIQFGASGDWYVRSSLSSGRVILQDTGGNVGIGTGTPASKLDVAGDINFTGSIRYQGDPLVKVSSVGLNTAIGLGVLQNNTIGSINTATGAAALLDNTTGFQNTASGASALQFNTTGSNNTASGTFALQNNTTGTTNTANGAYAMQNNTTGSYNTASGASTLTNNATGGSNAATGVGALYFNTTGNQNTASGTSALQNNTTGSYNTASGEAALVNNTTGSNNIAIGQGAAANVSGGNSNNIHMGSQGSGVDSGAIRIGTPGTQTSFFAAGVRGVTTANNDAIPIVIDSAGQLGTVSSSRRFKQDIQDMGDASRGLMRLRPVTFRYQKPFSDGSQPIQYGLIAEEVAEVYPDLVAHSADGQIETVKYQVLSTMLLNEVQRQRREIEALKAQLNRLSVMESRLAALENAGAGNR
jgi:hypothetical protein